MKPHVLLILLAFAITGCVGQRGNPSVCGNHGSLLADTRQSATTVLLKPRPTTPSFYLISDHYLILMRPEAVISFLETRVAEVYGREDERLLAAIKARLPIANDLDLMRFTFTDTTLWSRPERVAAALLEAGSASVVDLWEIGEGRSLQSIVAMRLKGRGGAWRDFCEPTGQSILFVTDEIV
jgi:hypothetical protein